ncbi:MAG TPA: hypothetical protein VIH91_03645 [Terriglobales bacterium]
MNAKQQEVYDPKGKSQFESQLPPVFDIIAAMLAAMPVQKDDKAAVRDAIFRLLKLYTF